MFGHGLELGIGLGQLFVGFSECLPLRLDGRDDVVVLDDVDHKRAKTRSGLVLGLHRLHVEVILLDVLPYLPEVVVVNGVVVHVRLDLLQVRHVLPDVSHELLLGGVPGTVLDLDLSA